MLTNLTEDGHLTWNCHYCHTEQTVHVSHAHVQRTSPTCVVLPACPECFARNGSSTRTTLTVVFPQEELTPEFSARPCVIHHQNLVPHLQAHGKVYTPHDPAVEEATQREQHKALILEVLKEQGVVPRAESTMP